MFNEREKCYDEFSNLFRQFQDANKGDFMGAKLDEFWQALPTVGLKVCTDQRLCLHMYLSATISIKIFISSCNMQYVYNDRFSV